MAPRPVIIDCDPGLDDAVMLLLAFASPDELDVLGVTVVAGNAGLAKTVLNARMVRELACRGDVPVYAGADRPLRRAAVEALDIHGETGLGGFDPVDGGAPAMADPAADWLARAIMARPGEITLVATGPLTNVALALAKEPRIATAVKQIVLMGGARAEGGNITPSAEFNIYADPHAADIVFRSGAPIVALGLDVTHQVRTTPDRLALLAPIGCEAARRTAAMWRFSNAIGHDLNGHDGAPLHDPCTIAWLLAPHLFSGRDCHIEVVTEDCAALGHTAVDYWGRSGRAPNAHWVDKADADGVFALIYDRLGRL